jgi:hypothetical protein
LPSIGAKGGVALKHLLNISTHGHDLEVIEHDWDKARRFLISNSFHGYELYPVDGYPFARIPEDIILGMHLRFFVIYEPLWRGQRERLLEIFGDMDTVEHFYGGRDRYAIVDCYRRQLELAARFGCEYAVFHISQCDLEQVHSWNCSWTWQETVDLMTEIVNASTADTPFTGRMLFENLWWPGSMRLDDPAEIDRLMQRVDYPNSGIVLDTGHVLNKTQRIRTELEGIRYLLDTVRNLGEARSLIHGVHLTRSLSAEYVLESQRLPPPVTDPSDFFARLSLAHEHVCRIDQHDAFEHPAIRRLFDLVSPEYLVFEFSFKDLAEWQAKIDRQRQALGDIL